MGRANDSNLWNLRYRVRVWGRGEGGEFFPPRGLLVCMHKRRMRQTLCQNRLTLAPRFVFSRCELPRGHGLRYFGNMSQGNPICTQNTRSAPSWEAAQKVQNKGDGRTRHANVQRGRNWQPTISASILIRLCFKRTGRGALIITVQTMKARLLEQKYMTYSTLHIGEEMSST